MNVPAVSPPLDEVTTALLDLFALTGRTGYDGAYGGNPVQPGYPYWILFAIPGGSADPFPDLDLDLSTVTAVWQVSAVSNYRNQAQQLARMCRDLILGRGDSDWLYPISVPSGWQVTARMPDPALAGVIRSGDAPTAVWTAPVRFNLTIARA